MKLLEEKTRIRRLLENRLDKLSLNRARNDHHSRRKPRPCGMTIHTGIGCSYGCTYCYIYDMGFPGRPQPYPLRPLELVYALTLNPFVLPNVTFAAYGSVTEPFLKETRDLAVEYLKEVFAWLKLPSQISTKSVIDEELAKRLTLTDPNLNILITLITLEKHRELEPGAPSPYDRLQGAEVAIRHGLKVTLFVRPIIPTVTDREIDRILAKAIEHGINTVVFGSLRVTPGIINRLRLKGINVEEIIKRLPREPKRKDEQITIIESDIKKRVINIAKDYGFKVFETACAANVYAHSEYCNACHYGPCGDPKRAPKVSESEIAEYLEVLGIRKFDIAFHEDSIRVKVKTEDRKLIDIIRFHLMFATRRRIEVMRAS